MYDIPNFFKPEKSLKLCSNLFKTDYYSGRNLYSNSTLDSVCTFE